MANRGTEEAQLPLVEGALGGVARHTDSYPWIHTIDNPYLHGLYAPSVHTRASAEGLKVEGELPHDLYGAYLRNGPNVQHCPKNPYHPFDGDGQIQGVYFRDGKASFRSNMVATRGYTAEQRAGKALYNGVMGPFDTSMPDFPIKDTANTDVLWHNGRLIALWYLSGVPYQLDPVSLETVGALEFDGRFTRTMSAHSRSDWRTGELLFFDYGDIAPYMTYGVMAADGRVVHETAIDLPGPRAPHEITFTSQYTIFHDHPFFHDIDVLRRHNVRVVRFHQDMPSRFGVMPRRGTKVRWFECLPCYVLHTSNAWEEGDWVIIDGCRSANPMPQARPEEGALAHMLAYMRPETNNYRWRLNMRTGEVREGPIDDLNTEFNKSNQWLHGTKTRYAYHQYIPTLAEGGNTLRFSALIKYDNDTGGFQRYDYGDGVYGSEAPFVPKRGAGPASEEDDGYVTTIVTDTHDWTSRCLVFDARDITSGPIATVHLPHRLPAGFHGTWVRGQDIWSSA